MRIVFKLPIDDYHRVRLHNKEFGTRYQFWFEDKGQDPPYSKLTTFMESVEIAGLSTRNPIPQALVRRSNDNQYLFAIVDFGEGEQFLTILRLFAGEFNLATSLGSHNEARMTFFRKLTKLLFP